jgi:3-methyladenine DNA glycosylase/8-oxoguanine DNA glycosylase
VAARGEPLSWRRTIKLRGAGGERVDFARTVLSHGVADLPPNSIERDGTQIETVLPAGGRGWVLRLRPTRQAEEAVLQAPATAPPKELRPELLAQVRHMLRLDDDLSPFYTAAADDPMLTWVVEQGAGRMLRSPTVFEDVVKTICTTNCAWSATERMVGAIVGELGVPAEGAPERRTFPTAAAVAAADPNFFRDVARAGYRGAYLKQLAADVAEGRLDLEALNDPALGDEEVAERLLALPGVGPYATAHMMMLLGRYRRLILDSWTRPTYRRLSGRARITDKGIERAFRRYREFAGLAFWLTLTRDWVSA